MIGHNFIPLTKYLQKCLHFLVETLIEFRIVLEKIQYSLPILLVIAIDHLL